MKKLSLLIISAFILSACSLSDTFKEEPLTSSPAESPAPAPADDQEFAVDSYNEKNSSEIAVEEQKIVPEKSPDEYISSENKEMPPEEPKLADFQKEPVIPEVTQTIAAKTHSYSLGAEEKYHIQKGDTLMMVAFKIYGDYRKWKDLKEWNKDKVISKMGTGDVLKYYVPEQSFGWKPDGLPYMVKTGDNLGMISMEKYGTSKKWKNIYENNRPLIRDPNLIFAGFTIYYLPIRDIASEAR